VTAKHGWHPTHVSAEEGRECHLCGERVFDKPGGPKMSRDEIAGMLGGMSGSGGG
jgi:hypothetical protein